MSAIGVTKKILFERLYLVPEMGTFGPWVTCPYAPTTPTVYITTISRFLCNDFNRPSPDFFGHHDSPSNLAESRYIILVILGEIVQFSRVIGLSWWQRPTVASGVEPTPNSQRLPSLLSWFSFIWYQIVGSSREVNNREFRNSTLANFVSGILHPFYGKATVCQTVANTSDQTLPNMDQIWRRLWVKDAHSACRLARLLHLIDVAFITS